MDRIGKWIDCFEKACFDDLGIMKMTKEVKDMLVKDMKEWNQKYEEMQERIAIMEEGKLHKEEAPGIGMDASGVWFVCPGCGHKLKPLMCTTAENLAHFPKCCEECGKGIKWELEDDPE